MGVLDAQVSPPTRYLFLLIIPVPVPPRVCNLQPIHTESAHYGVDANGAHTATEGKREWEAVLKCPRWKMSRWNSLDRAKRFLHREEQAYHLLGGGGGYMHMPERGGGAAGAGKWLRDGPPLCFGYHTTPHGKTGLLMERVRGGVGIGSTHA